jgi:phosphoglycerate dehydrogenase-like enzyme
MGIIGFGGVGREIASRAHAFGMKVIAVDINDVRKPDFIEEIWKPDHLPRLLQESDAVTIALPLTDRTRGLFNQELFRQMKRTPFLINVSRGEIMDMNALIEALEEGWIAGAGLDVAPEEPLPSENPLWKMENVVITPHIAGLSPMRMQRNWELFLENLRRWVNKEPLLSLFDRQQRF